MWSNWTTSGKYLNKKLLYTQYKLEDKVDDDNESKQV